MGVRLWVPEGQVKQTSRVAINSYTDNQSNESLLKKFMTSKFPSTLMLIQLVEELIAKRCELKLQWFRRDDNQLADDLTNGSSTPLICGVSDSPERGRFEIADSR